MQNAEMQNAEMRKRKISVLRLSNKGMNHYYECRGKTQNNSRNRADRDR